MLKRDARRARLGLETLEDRTALAAGLSSSLELLPPTLSIAQLPNDPRFSEEWALRNSTTPAADINATQAWDVATGSTKMVVSIMDTGVDYKHPDLYLNIWLNQGEIPASRRANLTDIDGDALITFRDLNDARNKGAGKITDQDGDGRITGADLLRPMGKTGGADNGTGGWADGASNNGDAYVDDIIGWDFADGDNDPMDTQGHGTHVAGTIGANGNDGVGVAGINWKIQMMPIRFMDGDGKGTIAQFITGLEYAVAKGAKVSNNSWIGAGISDTLTDAINVARSKGHILVCAAGNQAEDNDVTPNYPASYAQDNVLAVAAIDPAGKLASYSNWGKTTVDLAAPGSNILSTAIGGGYKYNSGTSMATPHVAGVVALVWSQHPTWTYSQVIAQILSTADKTAATDGKMRAGLLDAAGAVGYAQVTATPPAIINALNPTGSTTALATFRVTFDRAMSVSSFTTGDVVVTGPGGQTIAVSSVKAVAGSGDKVFDITLGATQTAVGNYTLKVGTGVTDTSGKAMSLFSKVFTIAAPASPPVIINAINPTGSTTTLNTFRVTFNRAMSVSSFTTGDVVVLGPSGQAIAVSQVKSVAGYADKVFDIVLGATQAGPGSFTLKIGPAVSDTAGKAMAAVFQKVFTLASPAKPPAVINANSFNGTATSLNTFRVTFDRAMSPSSFTAADVVVLGPSGQAIAVSQVKSVAGYADKVFDIVLGATQAGPGSFTLKIGPAVSDTAGKAMAAVFQKVFTLASPAKPPAVINANSFNGTATSLNTFRVTFDRAMSPSSFTAADVVVTGPGGKVIAVSLVKSVAGYGDRVFDIVLSATQTAAGGYTLKIGPAVTDVAGVAMGTVFQKAFTVAAGVAAPVIVNANNYGGSASSLSTVRVTFDRAMSATSFSAADVVVTAPGNKAVAVSQVKAVAGYGDKVFDIVLGAKQTAAGSYSVKIGPAVTDVAGVAMASAVTKVFTLAAASQVSVTTYTASTAVNIPKGGTGVSMLTVPDGYVVGDVNVRLNISFQRAGDLYIHLQAPDGTDVLLSNRRGGNGANYVNAVLDDGATQSLALYTAPFSGSYKPDTLLSQLANRGVNGAWKLWVTDKGGVYAGQILSWSLVVTPKGAM